MLAIGGEIDPPKWPLSKVGRRGTAHERNDK